MDDKERRLDIENTTAEIVPYIFRHSPHPCGSITMDGNRFECLYGYKLFSRMKVYLSYMDVLA